MLPKSASARRLPFLHQEQAIRAVANLRPIDIEKAYHVRDIIISRAENPPSLLELAQLVGLGDTPTEYFVNANCAIVSERCLVLRYLAIYTITAWNKQKSC